MTISFGIFPIVGLVLAAVLYAVHRLWLRMKCSPRSTQRYIKMAVIASLLVTFVHPVRVVPNEVPTTATATPSGNSQVNIEEQTVGGQITNLMQTDLTIQTKTNETIHLSSSESEGLNLVVLIYIIGVGGVLSYILFQLGWLLRVRLHNRLIDRNDDVCIYESTLSTPFSFGRNIFLPVSLDQDMKQYVLLHEHSHLRHKHFQWLCLMEIIIALQWFNPLVWMLLNELKLHQEMEVDSELMKEGVDREEYQMSLLRVCSNSGRWVLMQTAFGASPLKYRILFMNDSIGRRTSVLRIAAAAVLLLAFVGTSFALSFRTELEKNPLDGCWTMDWIRNTNDKNELVPSLTNNLFYGNGMQMNFSWFSRYGVNMRFNFSGEQMPYHDGVLYNAAGDSLLFNMIDDDTHQMQWHKAPNQVTLVSGPDITEQWHRVKPDRVAMRILRAMYTAGKDRSHRICGVWQVDHDTIPNINHYFVVNGDIYFTLSYHYADQDKYLRRGAGGWSGDFRWIDDNTIFLTDRNATVEWRDDNHITINTPRTEYEDIVSYHRIESLPADFHKILTAAFPEE